MVKFLFGIGTLILALIPTWIFLLVKSLLEPDGFWQNFVVYGAGLLFLGTLQFVLIFLWIGVMLHLLSDKW